MSAEATSYPVTDATRERIALLGTVEGLTSHLTSELDTYYGAAVLPERITLELVERILTDAVRAVEMYRALRGDPDVERARAAAVEALWQLLQTRGGTSALRGLLDRALARVVPQPIRALALRLLVNERLARALLRFLVDLAARAIAAPAPTPTPSTGTV